MLGNKNIYIEILHKSTELLFEVSGTSTPAPLPRNGWCPLSPPRARGLPRRPLNGRGAHSGGCPARRSPECFSPHRKEKDEKEGGSMKTPRAVRHTWRRYEGSCWRCSPPRAPGARGLAISSAAPSPGAARRKKRRLRPPPCLSRRKHRLNQRGKGGARASSGPGAASECC